MAVQSLGRLDSSYRGVLNYRAQQKWAILRSGLAAVRNAEVLLDYGRAGRAAKQAMETIENMSIVTQHDSSDANVDSIPYWRQGDKSLYSPEVLRLRMELRRSHAVRQGLHELWETTHRSQHVISGADTVEVLTRMNYLAVLRPIYRLLLGSEATEADLQDDWISDSAGSLLTRERFCDAMFELTDIWTSSTDEAEYGLFLRGLVNLMEGRIPMLQQEEGLQARAMLPPMSTRRLSTMECLQPVHHAALLHQPTSLSRQPTSLLHQPTRLNRQPSGLHPPLLRRQPTSKLSVKVRLSISCCTAPP